MTIKKYDGILGKFDYDVSQFEIATRSTVRGDFEYLKYIGGATDGDSIKIPKGIKNTRYMFLDNKSLLTAPSIPRGVEDISFMFSGCEFLATPPDFIPNTVKKADGAFKNCATLVEAPYLEAPIDSHVKMFVGCNASIYEGPSDKKYSGDDLYQIAENAGGKVFSKRRKTIDTALLQYNGPLGTFEYDPDEFVIDVWKDEGKNSVRPYLKYVGDITDGRRIHIPEGVIDLNHTFYGCDLSAPPKIPDGVKNLSYMLYGNHRLSNLPVIPDSVISAINIIDKDTERNLSAKGIGYKKRLYNFEHQGEAWDKSDDYHIKKYKGQRGEFEYDDREFGFADSVILSSGNKKLEGNVDFSKKNMVSYTVPVFEDDRNNNSMYLILDEFDDETGKKVGDKCIIMKPGKKAEIPEYAKSVLDSIYVDKQAVINRRAELTELKNSGKLLSDEEIDKIKGSLSSVSDEEYDKAFNDAKANAEKDKIMSELKSLKKTASVRSYTQFRYIGSDKKDMSNVKVPDGCKDMSYMFSYMTKMEKPPVIVDSHLDTNTNTFVQEKCAVEKMDYAFYCCKNLRVAAVYPSSVRSITHTYDGCEGLKGTLFIPENVVTAKYAYNRCKSLNGIGDIYSDKIKEIDGLMCGCENANKFPEKLPDSIKSAQNAFINCKNMETAPVLSSGLENSRAMFKGCSGLINVAESLPDTVKDASVMYAGCESLKRCPVIPESVENVDNMVAGCNKSVWKQFKFQNKNRGKACTEEQIERFESEVPKDGSEINSNTNKQSAVLPGRGPKKIGGEKRIRGNSKSDRSGFSIDTNTIDDIRKGLGE